jgi:hypothetical protein
VVQLLMAAVLVAKAKTPVVMVAVAVRAATQVAVVEGNLHRLLVRQVAAGLVVVWGAVVLPAVMAFLARRAVAAVLAY